MTPSNLELQSWPLSDPAEEEQQTMAKQQRPPLPRKRKKNQRNRHRQLEVDCLEETTTLLTMTALRRRCDGAMGWGLEWSIHIQCHLRIDSVINVRNAGRGNDLFCAA